MSDSAPSGNKYHRRIPSVETMLLFANQFSDVDSAAWAWLLLEDIWGESMAMTMWSYAQHAGRCS